MLVGLEAVKPVNALDDQRLEKLLFLVIFYIINFEFVPPSSQSLSGDFHILRPQAPSRSPCCAVRALQPSVFSILAKNSRRTYPKRQTGVAAEAGAMGREFWPREKKNWLNPCSLLPKKARQVPDQ